MRVKQNWVVSEELIKVDYHHETVVIAVITVEPADKISFVYNCMQTRVKGQYNGK